MLIDFEGFKLKSKLWDYDQYQATINFVCFRKRWKFNDVWANHVFKANKSWRSTFPDCHLPQKLLPCFWFDKSLKALRFFFTKQLRPWKFSYSQDCFHNFVGKHWETIFEQHHTRRKVQKIGFPKKWFQCQCFADIVFQYLMQIFNIWLSDNRIIELA